MLHLVLLAAMTHMLPTHHIKKKHYPGTYCYAGSRRVSMYYCLDSYGQMKYPYDIVTLAPGIRWSWGTGVIIDEDMAAVTNAK